MTTTDCISDKDKHTTRDPQLLASHLTRDAAMSLTGSPGPEAAADTGDGRPFVCGVVEGFYGRPWTLAQRKDLFDKMESWGMSRFVMFLTSFPCM